MDLIRIVGLELRCIVGLRSYERHREQPLRVDIALGLDLSRAGRSGKITESVDYSGVADAVAALLRFREYRLLEVAAEESSALLFATYPQIGHVEFRIDKPEALAGRARCASVEISRSRGGFGNTEEPTEYGGRTEVLRTREGVIERLRVQAGKSVSLRDPVDRLECIASGKARGGFATICGASESSYAADGADLLICRCMALSEEADESALPSD